MKQVKMTLKAYRDRYYLPPGPSMKTMRKRAAAGARDHAASREGAHWYLLVPENLGLGGESSP